MQNKPISIQETYIYIYIFANNDKTRDILRFVEQISKLDAKIELEKTENFLMMNTKIFKNRETHVEGELVKESCFWSFLFPTQKVKVYVVF